MLFRRKPVFAIAERWTSTHKPKEIITAGMKGFPLYWEDEFGHRFAMREQDGWVQYLPAVNASLFGDGEVIRKGDWVVTEKGCYPKVMTDSKFRSLYDPVCTDPEREETPAQRDTGKA